VLIVTGTKRSGTSLWMQILIAAGFPAFGEAFPGQWRETLGKANVDGFFESLLREGIYYETNPHPRTGDYFFPEQVEWHCVKVFIPGLVRSDRAYIGRVIATVREWREHEASLNRLRALESAQRAKERAEGDTREPAPRISPPLEWWSENFALIRDISIRRYPVHVQTYDGLLRDPERVITATLQWLGRGEVRPACEQVRESRRNFNRPSSETLEAPVASVFDELYAALESGKSLSPSFLEKLNDTNDRLAPLFAEYRKRLEAHAARLRTENAGS
jgi:hypothetical protein